jgi:photosystem II stability/assembly factor-like uncharacterized protein
MTVVSFRSVLAVVLAVIGFTAPLLAQSLQPSKTGLPGRTVWALTTSATGSGAARQTFTFAATDKGLWKSTDNGGVWTEVPALKNQEVYAVKARQVGTTTTLLAATKKGILRSQDGGTTWASPEVTTGTVVSTSNILELKKVFDIEIVNSTWYAATEKGVFRSTNDGRSWTLLNIDRSVDNNEVRGITAEGSTIIVNLWKEGLWRSTNNGGSWAKLSIAGETALCRLVYAHPGTSGTVWLAGSVAGNLWRSVNGGSSWTRVTTGSTTARSSAQTGITLAGIDAMTSLGRVLFAGTATRVVVSYNDGQTWRPYPIQTTKPLSMASNGRNILFIGFENEQNTSLAAKESSSQTHNSDPGVISYNNPLITKINYSQNPIRAGQTIDVEILGEYLTLPPSLFTMVDKFEIFNFSNPNTLFWTEQFLISQGNPFQAPIQARVISQAFDRVVIRYPIPDIILSVISSYPNPYARISFYHMTVPEPVSAIDPVFLGPGYPALGNSITDYFVPVAKTEPTLTGPTTPLLRTGVAQNITLTGTNFVSGTTKVFYSLNGGTRTELTPVSVSSPTSLGVTLPATALTATGTIAFTAESTAGSPSAALNVLVHNPPPTIQSFTPTTYTRNSNNPITITGTGFVPESRIRLDNSTGWFIPTYFSPTQVRFSALAQYNTGGSNAAATSFQLLVDNPLSSNNQGGGVSANVTIPIVNPAPSLSTINPLQIFTGQQATIALSASSLMPNTVAQFNNKTYTIAPAGFSQTAIIIPPTDLTTTGSYPITLFTPAPGGGTSQQVFVSVVHPQPAVSSIAPTTVNAGRDTTVTLTGSSFISGALVYIENVTTPLATTFVSGTSLRAVVPANRIPTNGTYRFYVVNPTPNGPLGGTSGFVDLTVNTPVANLTGINPATLTASAIAQTLTLSGTFFETNAVAWISGTGITTRALTTTVQNAALATATVPADLAGRAGTYTITLKNPNAPDSQTQTLTIQNPAPTLQTLNPASTLAGSNGITLTLRGTNFVQGAVVVFNGTPLTPSAVIADSITVSVPSSALTVASSVQVLVRNPAPSAGDSPALPFAINNPLPRLDSAIAHPLQSGILLVSTQATTVTLYGGNFIIGSYVRENGGNRTESTLSSQRLTQGTMTATVPVEMTAQAGIVRLLVENLSPGGGRSQADTLTVVNPIPVVQRITPGVVVQSANPLGVTITGDRFVAGAEVLVNGQTVTVSENTPTRLTISIPAHRIAARGLYSVVVRNPQTTTVSGTPDGGVSTPLTLTVTTPQALVSGINLTQVPLDTVDVPLVITGSRFLDSAIVRITAPNNVTVSIATTSISANTINALLGASVLNRGGVYSVTVQNPAPTEAVSTAFTFAVVNPAPVVDSIAPRSVQPLASGANPSITVFGKLFTPTSVVRWRGQDLPTTFVGRTRLTATLPATLQPQGGVGAVTVFTPTDGVTFMGNEVGGGTGSVAGALGTLLVSHAVPSLTALGQTMGAPTTVIRDAWGTQPLPTLSMTGELFASNATVRLLSADSTVNTNIAFSSQSPTTLAVQLPRVLMAKTGVVRVRVQNQPAFVGMFASWLSVPDGGLSEERFFTMVNPAPTLGSLTPASVAVAAPGNLALSLSGTNFIPESVLLVNGRVWTRSVTSAVSMTASLPDSLFTLSGYVNVRVVNPAPVLSGGVADSSNVLQLEIFNPVPTLAAVAPVFTTIQGRTPADSVTITLTGTNFVRNSVARLALTTAGSPTKEVPTTFRSRDTLLVRLLAADWTAAAYNLSVLNPAPRGGTSVARRFTVSAPAPVLTALLPASTTATGKAWTLTLTGRFFTAASQVSYRNTLQSLTNTAYLPGTSGNADTLRVKLVAVPVGDTTFPVVVYNPPTGGLGGGVSDTLRLAVGLPVPQITTLSPASTTSTLGVKERRGVLTVNGSLFDDAAKVFIQGQAVPTEFVSTTRLRAYLPDSLLANQARRTVQVRNTPVLVSNLVNFTVQNPTPVLNALTPGTITAGRDTVLTLTGDKFAPDATVSLTYGSTVTPLAVLRRDSVLSLQVRVPDTLITRRGAYTVRVTNRPLVLDTNSVGGGADTYTLTVIAAPIARVEVAGTDTLLNAGDRSAFITLRFRDPSGNLVDADPVSVSFAAAPDTSLPLALRPTPATGAFPVQRTSIGTYRLDTLRFYQAGTFTLRIDTSVTGAVPVVGPTRFVVRPLADATADMTGLRGTGSPLPAGDTLPSVTVVLKDKFGNFTDNTTAKWSFVRSTGVPAGGHVFTSTATVRGVRLGTGYYRLEATQVVGAGLYTYSLDGVGTGFVYNGERTALVTPLAAVNTDFSNLRDSIVAGGKQSKVQVIFTDRYRNRTDALLPEHRTLLFSNSGDTTTLPSEAFTQAEVLTQRTIASGMYAGTPVLGVYDASNALIVPFAGRYRLAVPRITTTTGTQSFVVVPAGDFFVTMTGVKDTITAGEELPAFTVSYRDRFQNPTDNGVGRVFYMHPSGSSTATLPMTRLDEGEYRVSSTVATLAGTYSLNVRNVDARNISGNRHFVVRPQIPVSATMVLSTTAMKAGGANVTITATFLDTFGNPTVTPVEALLENQTLTGVNVLATFQKTGTIGKYTTTATVLQPGVYKVRVNVNNAQGQPQSTIDPDGTDRFNINPGLGLKATFVNIPSALPLGDTLNASWNIYVRVTDTLNAPTNAWDGDGRATGSLGGTTRPVAFVQRDANYNTHSGVFDLHPQTVFTQAGRYTLKLFHRQEVDVPMPGIIEIPFRSYTGNGVFDIVPKPVITTISPSVTLASVSPFALTVEGTGFTANNRIVVGNNTQASTQLLSPTMLRVSYVAETAGTLNVKVLSNMTRGVHSAAMPLTVVEPIKTAFVTITGIPPYVFAGAAIPTVQVSVVDSATGQPLNLNSIFARWYRKGVESLPLVLMPTGPTGQYAAMCPKPTVTEAAEYFLELSAQNAIVRVVAPQNPVLQVLGNQLRRVKVEDFMPAPAPLYRDILPGHYQGDTIPAFTIRGYDQYDNLTAIPFGLALYRAASPTAPAMTLPLPQRTIWRGVVEVLPFRMDSTGEFSLIQTDLPVTALVPGGKPSASTHAGPVTVPLVDGNNQPLPKMLVIPIQPEEERFPTYPPELLVQPILLCANPFIIPLRNPSAVGIDPETPQSARNRYIHEDYELVWSDEFKGTALNEQKWTRFRTRTSLRGGAPGMPYEGVKGGPGGLGATYDENNVTVGNDCLHLAGRYTDAAIPNLSGDDFKAPNNVHRSGAGIHTRYKADFRYCKIVVKVKKVPNFPIMHQGVWMFSSENGAPGLEVDFPDGANSPHPWDSNGPIYQWSSQQPNKPPFLYTYLNNSHPRMAMSVIGTKTDNTSFGEYACSGPPDPNNELELELEDKEREYWMEWDKDKTSGYVKVGVNAKDRENMTQLQTLEWWGLNNHTFDSGSQYIPASARPLYMNATEINRNTVLGRFEKARPTEQPFNRYPYWYFDHFPMYLILNFDASSGWAGGGCLELPNYQFRPAECDDRRISNDPPVSTPGYISQNIAALRNNPSMDIDYVRIYQRNTTPFHYKPIILDGANFTDYSLVFLSRTADPNAPHRAVETRPIDATRIVALLSSADEVFLRENGIQLPNGEAEGFVRVVNHTSNGTPLGASAFRRIIFGTSEATTIRANMFMHRYQTAQPNPTIGVNEPPLRIKGDDNAPAPNFPFKWTGQIDKLNMDLFNIPALGGTPAAAATATPPAYSTLNRLQEARGKWELRLRSAADGTTWSPTQTLPVAAHLQQPSPLWRVEQPSQHRAGEGFNAVRVADDGNQNHIVRELGFYPTCSDLIEVTTFVATPAEGRTGIGGIYDDVNLCGPFRIRYYLDPRPQARITERTQAADPNNQNRFTLTVGVQLETSPMMGTTTGTGSSYVWQRQILRRDINGVWNVVQPPWPTITTGILANNAQLSGRFTETNLQAEDSIQVRCVMTFPDAPINTLPQAGCRTVNSSVAPVLSVQEPQALVFAKTSSELNSTQQSLAQKAKLSANPSHTHTVNLSTAPNPADAEVHVRFGLPLDASVTVEVLDVLQRPALASLTNTQLSAGEHDTMIALGSLPSGVYSVRVQAKLNDGRILQEQRTLLLHR